MLTAVVLLSKKPVSMKLARNCALSKEKMVTWCVLLPQEQCDKLAVSVSLTLVPHVLLKIL